MRLVIYGVTINLWGESNLGFSLNKRHERNQSISTVSSIDYKVSELLTSTKLKQIFLRDFNDHKLNWKVQDCFRAKQVYRAEDGFHDSRASRIGDVHRLELRPDNKNNDMEGIGWMDAHLNRCTVGEQGSEGGGGGGGREEEAVKLSSLASSQLKESLLWHLWRSPREEEGEVVQSVELEEEASMGSSQPGLTCSDNDTDHMVLESI
ncbi:hypothetical protein GW17_00031127 [Ensete ventricosum]|nr:hypothetical protein GW17_00031127 [Ensete ventricosum]RZS01313.1 hypothetical protein BHM03_00031152 [Ensete ventricosum]